MCGRVFVKSTFAELMAAFADVKGNGDNFAGLDTGPRFNGAPSLTYPIIVADRDAPSGVFTLATWGFVPRWSREAKPGRAPPNARSETVATNGMFRDAYRSRRCLMPVNGYFEWKAIKGKKQPYALAMADDTPFCIAAIWEPRRDPDSRPGTEGKTFAVITCPPNDLVATIHDRMPVILHKTDYARWLSDEADPSDLMVPFPGELMKIWPVSTSVNKAGNEGADLLEPVELDDGGPPDTLL